MVNGIAVILKYKIKKQQQNLLFLYKNQTIDKNNL